MSTISVPLPPELETKLDELVQEGAGANRADVMRKALALFIEDTAVMHVLMAEQEVTQGKILRGSIEDVLG
jgi:Arc/MetJ-type ribon-helix-helix transcriptional regulator